MKTLSTYIFVFLSINVAAQIGVNKQYHKRDTSRTFLVMDGRNDEMIQKLKINLGEPDVNSTGNIVWELKDIPNRQSPVTIKVHDGLMSPVVKGCWNFSTFRNEADKTEKLELIEDGYSRSTEIKFENAEGINVVRSNKQERFFQEYLTSLLN
jgi:hypothetical protein